MRRFIRLTVPALLLAAALASGLGCTGGSEEASSPTPRATTATASPSPVAAPAARSAPAATATSAPSPTTTTHELTISATGAGRVSPLPGTYSHLDGESVTVTATPDEGYAVASWGGNCSGAAPTCTLTMDADKTASVTFGLPTHTLTVAVTGEGGEVTPVGTTEQARNAELTLTASWNDATHDFTGWAGDCVATTSTCVLTMEADKAVTATFTELPATRCATTTAADCIRAVYRGAPGDYTQVADIPAEKLFTRTPDGRYHVECGEQYTVVTAAQLPEGWTRFYLQQDPGPTFGVPSPVSASQLIKPIGTTYTFTVSEDDNPPGRFTYQLKAAKPFVRPRSDGKPHIGDVVVATTFQAPSFSYDSFDTTGAAPAAGSYALLMPDTDSETEGTTTSVTTYEELRTKATVLLFNVTAGDAKAQDGFYDTVEVDDLVEWRSADDCWMRMQVTEELTGTATTKQYAVKPYSYAYGGCTGAVPAAIDTEFRWIPPNLDSLSLAGAMMHGPMFARQRTWSGSDPAPVVATTVTDITWPPDPLPNPDLGPDWSGSIVNGYGGLEGSYRTDDWSSRFDIAIGQHWTTPAPRFYYLDPDPQQYIYEFLLVDGHPAVLRHERVANLQRPGSVGLTIYDLDHDVRYSAVAHGALRSNTAELIGLVRKFMVIR